MPNSIQSDYWYIDETNEFLVCEVNEITGPSNPCLGQTRAFVPYIYSIDRATNVKTKLYPINDPQITDESATGFDAFVLVPDCNSDFNFSEITKPLISYNEKDELYNISFLGKYTDKNDGVTLFNYIFQYVNEQVKIVRSIAIVPEAKKLSKKYTFENGHINTEFFIEGNSSHASFLGVTSELFTSITRPVSYKVKPVHHNNDLRFNFVNLDYGHTGTVANSALPLCSSGGYIAQRGNDLAYRTDNCIRVDFTCKSFSLSGESQLGMVQMTELDGVSAARWVEAATLSAGPAEGFCVFFYEPTQEDSTVFEDVDLNGVNSSLGYCPASAIQIGQDRLPAAYTGITLPGYVAIAFDLNGNFATTAEGKSGYYTDGLTISQTLCTIGIRGNKVNDYKALSQSTAITAVPLHEYVEAAGDATYKDFRVELTKQGKEIIIFGKLNISSDYIELHRLDMSRLPGYNFTVPPKLKVGLSSTTGGGTNLAPSVFNFELKSFKVKGVKAT